jgi:hypothetical protein
MGPPQWRDDRRWPLRWPPHNTTSSFSKYIYIVFYFLKSVLRFGKSFVICLENFVSSRATSENPFG